LTSTYDEQIDSILNASGVEGSFLRVTDNGDLDWSPKSQKSAGSTSKSSYPYYSWNRKRSEIWKAKKKYTPKDSGGNFRQMVPELFKLISDNKFLIQTTGNSISQTSYIDSKKSALNDVNTTDLSSKDEKEKIQNISQTSSVASEVTPILNTSLATQYPARATFNSETQNHSLIVDHSVQQDKSYSTFSFASVGTYFNINGESSGQVYNGSLQSFTALFLKTLNQPLILMEWFNKTSFDIFVPQYLVFNINYQRHVYESQLLTLLENDSLQFFLQFIANKPTLSGSVSIESYRNLLIKILKLSSEISWLKNLTN
jgi:hypothetical protein